MSARLLVAVAGGGASGLAAALAASRAGARVVLFEKGRALGRKVLASGGGRCNLSNDGAAADRYHGGGRPFVEEVLAGFGAPRVRGLFEDLGLLLMAESDGRVFPRCGRAEAVVGALEAALREAGCELRTETEVRAVRREKDGFLLDLAGPPLRADRLVLCCGGAGYPKLGGGEGGYALARSLGHSSTELSPALVPLLAKEGWLKHLQGLRVEAGLHAQSGGRTVARTRGELLFTAYGLSGPAALDASREVCRALGKGRVDCAVDLFPEMEAGELSGLLARRLERLGGRPLKGFLAGMLADRVVSVFLDSARLDPAAPARSADLKRLANSLKSWRFEASGPRPWDEAMVTAGGVRLSEVEPSTLGSKLCPGLFLAGEMLDVDGDSGGFNLHFAWASGWKAGAGAGK